MSFLCHRKESIYVLTVHDTTFLSIHEWYMRFRIFSIVYCSLWWNWWPAEADRIFQESIWSISVYIAPKVLHISPISLQVVFSNASHFDNSSQLFIKNHSFLKKNVLAFHYTLWVIRQHPQQEDIENTRSCYLLSNVRYRILNWHIRPVLYRNTVCILRFISCTFSNHWCP